MHLWRLLLGLCIVEFALLAHLFIFGSAACMYVQISSVLVLDVVKQLITLLLLHSDL